MAKNGATIRDNKKEWNRLAKSMRDIHQNGKHLEAGIFGEQGSDVVIYAAANEFGVPSEKGTGRKAGKGNTVTIPERSFLRGTYDQEKIKIYAMIAKNKLNIAKKGTSYLDRNLKRIGEYFVGKVRRRIANKDFTPNAPSTIKQKTKGKGGETTPLVDTGRLRQSITYRLAK